MNLKQYSNLLISSGLLLIMAFALCAFACSWDIITQGEINPDNTDEVATRTASVATTEPPDSISFKILSELEIGEVLYELVEMEVGELIDGLGGDPDTILVTH